MSPSPAMAEQTAAQQGKAPLFDLGRIDRGARLLSRAELERWNPHRGDMALLDWIVWQSEDMRRCVGLKQVRDDEFWVQGHFPDKPLFPGVLMIEAGAQLAGYVFNSRRGFLCLPAFLRIEHAIFRGPVVPGDDLFLLCQEVKSSSRRFVSDIQGMVDDRIAFVARIAGVELGRPDELLQSVNGDGPTNDGSPTT